MLRTNEMPLPENLNGELPPPISEKSQEKPAPIENKAELEKSYESAVQAFASAAKKYNTPRVHSSMESHGDDWKQLKPTGEEVTKIFEEIMDIGIQLDKHPSEIRNRCYTILFNEIAMDSEKEAIDTLLDKPKLEKLSDSNIVVLKKRANILESDIDKLLPSTDEYLQKKLTKVRPEELN